MKAIDLIRWAMQLTDQGLTNITQDMRNFAMLRPGLKDGKPAGNHTLWSVGHLAVLEGSLRRIIIGESNPVAHWEPLFGTGSQPRDDASLYPSFDEVLSTFHRLRAENLKLLERVGDSGLDRAPAFVPPGLEGAMPTIGNAALLIALHQMVHYGQIADARRAAGHAPLF